MFLNVYSIYSGHADCFMLAVRVILSELLSIKRIENLYSPKIHGRYRQDTDMYKRQKKNNNTQYTLQHVYIAYYCV